MTNISEMPPFYSETQKPRTVTLNQTRKLVVAFLFLTEFYTSTTTIVSTTMSPFCTAKTTYHKITQKCMQDVPQGFAILINFAQNNNSNKKTGGGGGGGGGGDQRRECSYCILPWQGRKSHTSKIHVQQSVQYMASIRLMSCDGTKPTKPQSFTTHIHLITIQIR